MSDSGFPLFGGDPEDLLRGLREFAEQQAESVQDAQREQFATLTLSTAVELTAAALKQVQASGGVDEQTIGEPPRVASPGYLDRIGAATRRLELALDAGGGRSPFAEAMKAAVGSIEELKLDVEAGYKEALS